VNPKGGQVNRRQLFEHLGAGLLVLVMSESALAQRENQAQRESPSDCSAWLHLGEDGVLTVFSGKVEVGQNVRTLLSQAVAEELHLPIERIRLVLGDTALTPYDAGTFGSRSTPAMIPLIRRAALAAREQLLELAATRWQVEKSMLTLADGAVQRPSGQSVSYTALLQGKALSHVIDSRAALTPPDRQQVMGKSVPKVDGRAFVTGQHKYTSDMVLEGMLYGRVLRPVAQGATLKSVELSKAQALPRVVVVHEGEFVGVAAPTTAEADRALAAIKAQWTTIPPASEADLFTTLRGGAPKPAMATTYTVAYIAHVPLEPRAAVAQWKGEELTVWTGTQRPFGVRSDLAAALKIPESRVRVIVPDTGSGYGGKHSGEAAIEAARLARGAGKPVKLVWTREEEFSWAYFRPAGVIDIEASLTPEGSIASWHFHNYNSGGSALRSPYEVGARQEEFHATQSPLRQGSYRGLAATANHFARESHMDDLARQAKLDPLVFRQRHLKDSRLLGVLEAATKAFGWERRVASSGRGFGLAVGTEKGSYVAHCVEVEVTTGVLKLVRIVVAFECGAIVNPVHLENQVEGSTVMGLGGALFEAIHYADGQITNGRMSLYRVPRFEDIPPIQTVLVNRPDLPSAGAGETPIVTIAPAIRNALLDATGVGLRSLPLIPGGKW
jgi:nicotinate dehydrogenase subunit B